MCALLVGLPDVTVTGVGDWPQWLRIAIEMSGPRPVCDRCGTGSRDHGRREVLLVDLPVFGRPARLVWNKQRWVVPEPVVHDGDVDRAGSTDRLGAVRVDDTGSTLGDGPGRRSRPGGVRGRHRSRL